MPFLGGGEDVEITCLVVAVIFLATLIRSAFGFGEALIAVPLLTSLRIPVETAAPLAVLVSITVAAVILVQDWHKVHPRSAGWLIFSTLLGIPLGLWLLKGAAESVVKMILATVIIVFSTYCLTSRRRLELKGDGLAWLFGFVAGVLGGAYGMNGPPLVIYGALRRWTPEHFRATLQGYFLPASAVGMVGYWLTGLWGWEVTRYYFLSLPAALAAVFLGRAVNRRLDGRRFLRYVHLGLIIIGIVLLAQALGKKPTPPDTITSSVYQGERRFKRVSAAAASRVSRAPSAPVASSRNSRRASGVPACSSTRTARRDRSASPEGMAASSLAIIGSMRRRCSSVGLLWSARRSAGSANSSSFCNSAIAFSRTANCSLSRSLIN
jgi:uncharacterized membrane protein YfcA